MRAEWDGVRMKREIEKRKRETERSGREIERHHAFRSTPGRLQPPSHTAAEKRECRRAWATALEVHKRIGLRKHETEQSRTEHKQKEKKYERREERVGMGMG